MASLIISDRAHRGERDSSVTIPDLNDEGLAAIVENVAYRFTRDGGVWIGAGGNVIGQGAMAWIPRERADVIANFDGDLPEPAVMLLFMN